MGKNGAITSPEVGMLPYAGNENEMLVMSSITDLNKLVLTFSLKTDPDDYKE